MSLPSPVTIEELKAFKRLSEEHEKKCRFHPIIAVLEQAIADGLLPVDGMKPNDGVYCYRGHGFCTFKGMKPHSFDPFIVVTLKISACDDDREVRELTETFYVPILLFRVDIKIIHKDFKAWCKQMRVIRSDRIKEGQDERKKTVRDVASLIDQPKSLSSYGRDY